MSRAKVVFLTGQLPRVVDLFLQRAPQEFDVTVVREEAPLAEKQAQVADADFILTHHARVSGDIIRRARRLRLLQAISAGLDMIDLTAAQEMGIPVANSGGANAWAVSELTILLMLAVYRKLIPVYHAATEGRWHEPLNGFNTFEIARKTVGIAGMGNIGKRVARLTQAFEATVQYYDPYVSQDSLPPEIAARQLPSLEEIMASSDIVSVHVPLAPTTHHLINADMIARMKPTAILINTSRGPLVDEMALYQALKEGRIAGAGLDVLEQEPFRQDHPLFALDNVVITPHCGGVTFDSWAWRAEYCYANMLRVWRGEKPQWVAPAYHMEARE